MEYDMAELATVDRLIKERDHIDDLLYLLNHGEIERVKEILTRDKESIEESLKTK